MTSSVVALPRTVIAAVGAAVAFLTRLPAAPATDRAGAAAFAVVGAGIGLAAALPVMTFSHAPLLGAALAIALVALLSGGLHLDGLADTLDALGAPNPDGAERARRDPAVGALGAAGLTLVLLADVAAIAGLPTEMTVPALLMAGAASRAVPVIGAGLGRRADAGLGRWWREAVQPFDVLACLGTLVVLALAGRSVAHAIALAAALVAGLTILRLLERRFGSVSGDSYGAAVEGAFLVALIVEVAA